MQAEPPRSRAFEAMAHSAVDLLVRALERRKLRPTEELQRLFFEAGMRGSRDERQLLTTEQLILAIARRGREADDTAGTNFEEAALIAASRVIRRNHQSYDQLLLDLAVPAKPPSLALSELSPNVERLLDQAVRIRGRIGKVDGALDVLRFLTVFPPESSSADQMLARLKISPSEIRSAAMIAAETWFAAHEASSEPEASPPTAEISVRRGSLKKAGPAKKAAPAPRRRAQPEINDSVATHADEPALIDQLERLPFAAVLARNIRQARASGESEASAFVVHLHGPWGSGKSSVLNFLEAELKKEDPPWLVVRFNAWRDQRRQPPWWSLITCIYAAACKKLDKQTSKRLWWRWFKWRVRADFMPWVVTGALVFIFAALLVLGLTSSIGPTVSAIGSTLTLIGAGAVAVRSLALGSQRAAQTYADLKADPFQPMTTLFDRLIGAIGRPVAVFIDDLDRCDSGYVVELLEGIQTLMRGAPVTYVVAADRKWICSSFEQRYAKFSPPIGEPGRPLGYLFLDKMFQISAAVPQLATDVRSSYWQTLLTVSGPSANRIETRERAEDARRSAEEEAKAALANFTTHEQLRGAVEQAEASKDPLAIQATRAEAAMRISSAEASVEAEHRLKGYADLLEPNPRSMKRLVNAYGMHHATLFLAGRSASPEALARWTILELRWPLLADFLAGRPNYVDRLRAPLAADESKPVPEALRDLFGDELVMAVVGPKTGKDRLHPDSLRAILGAVQGDR